MLTGFEPYPHWVPLCCIYTICCYKYSFCIIFSIGNYSEAVNDAKNAIELQPSFLKAFIRGKSTVVI